MQLHICNQPEDISDYILLVILNFNLTNYQRLFLLTHHACTGYLQKFVSAVATCDDGVLRLYLSRYWSCPSSRVWPWWGHHLYIQ